MTHVLRMYFNDIKLFLLFQRSTPTIIKFVLHENNASSIFISMQFLSECGIYFTYLKNHRNEITLFSKYKIYLCQLSVQILDHQILLCESSRAEFGRICTSRPIFDLASPSAIPLTPRSVQMLFDVQERMTRRHEIHPLWVLTL